MTRYKLSTATFFVISISLPLISFSGIAFSGWESSGSVSIEARIFPDSPAYAEQNDETISPSIVIEPEFVYEWNKNQDRITVTPFARWDADDDNRSHLDLREASWLHIADEWDLVVGISKVFWGVTESLHLVDIINQTDTVEDIDGEDKLGQPMVNLNLIRDWGTIGLFILPRFRERTFAAFNARLRGPVPIDVDNATYESSRRENNIDGALRWSHTLGDWDIGLGYFQGTSREPRFLLAVNNGQAVFVPRYDLIDQTSIDVQLTTDSTLWKLEAISRGGQGRRFTAAVAGLEYTFFGVLDSSADIGFLFEYLYDDRDMSMAPIVVTDDDVFLGARLTLNNSQATAFLAGAIIDRHSEETLFFMEAEHRLSDYWKFELQGRFFINIPDESFNAGFREDGFLNFRFSRYF